MNVSIILYGIAAIFVMICIGTSVGALSKATTDKKKASDMGITALAFCLLALMFIGGGVGASKLSPSPANAS